MSALTRYLERVGIETDTEINVATGGDLGQTVSMRAALAQRAGKRWGCLFCWFLSIAVQHDHCADQFISQPTPGSVYVRAAIAFVVAIGAVAYSLVRVIGGLV
jgi:hypothetical protein